MNTTTLQRRDSDDPAKLRELARIAAEWGRLNWPTEPKVVKVGENCHGTLEKFPWE